ncbi:hypothetical protein OG217_35155 [Streptomyces sp. NBC_01023]|uniref:hypothetical protein n=1 Tax=Streptomyces sp. NBC_01023 TaxID=2903724 RepID=UPI00386AE922|nr:hypothetical protein OG217_35155 [Streptomyces sp. NBC_01023]
MRRITTGIGILAAAAMIGLAVPGSAYAAEGRLVINGQEYDNPSGCYRSDTWPLRVINKTNEPALIFDGADCHGRVERIAPPGQYAISEFGQSVYVR